MTRSSLVCAFATLAVVFAACGDDNNTPTADTSDGDVPILVDVRDAVSPDNLVNDTSRDTPTTDTPATDTPTTDTPTTDTPVEDTPVNTDTPTTDTPVENDVPVTDIPTTDTPTTDTPTTDTPTTDTPTTDTPTTDTVDVTCSGACDPETQSTKCLAAGNICYCNPEDSTWVSFGCAEICESNYMVGDQCITTVDGDNCDCQIDCTKPALVEGQCTEGYYTECTCGSADPCSWVGDDYCDADCATLFVDDHFDDPTDCTCTGSCDPEAFSGFCDPDSNACNCEGGTKTVKDCATYCVSLGATLSTEEPCITNQGMAFCACENYTCGDATKVTAQCTANIYTPCTCGVADPCTWIADTSCDKPACDQLYPEQANFDDSASPACAQ